MLSVTASQHGLFLLSFLSPHHQGPLMRGQVPLSSIFFCLGLIVPVTKDLKEREGSQGDLDSGCPSGTTEGASWGNRSAGDYGERPHPPRDFLARPGWDTEKVHSSICRDGRDGRGTAIPRTDVRVRSGWMELEPEISWGKSKGAKISLNYHGHKQDMGRDWPVWM